MSTDKIINILMVDKQAIKLSDPLAEFLDISEEEHEYRLNSCDSYPDALSLLDGVDIALVQLDLTKEYFMPGDEEFLPWIDEENAGYRFLVYLKKQYSKIKVIMLVDYPACEETPSHISQILDKGADNYLIKPFVISDLVEEIHHLSRDI